MSAVAVIGIDPSLTRTGLARLTVADPRHAAASRAESPRWTAETVTRPSAGHTNDTVEQRNARLGAIARDVVAWSTPATLVVIEGPSYGSAFAGAAWDRAGLWWHIVSRVIAHGVPVAVVPPRTRAKWVTGNGNADKRAVYDAVAQLWGGSWSPSRPGDDNEADALVLASMGVQWLTGALPIQPQPSRAPLERCQWPMEETRC
ncbi:hypothetical protein [Amycolatopsis sp. CA-128772]|uniref:hypothetical protein n=1 Tax=Amycolatopsis sp. CA-128772 TaxID=2073159 RepID=UPI000CD05359|nr:hypothetical protein [Amycolatopsis sp. CA-128772]